MDGDYKPPTPKPTLAEIIQMSEKRLRLASMHNAEATTSSPKVSETETSFITSVVTVAPNSTNSVLTPTSTKAEKKVTFANLLDKLTGTLSTSSSCSELSGAEEKALMLPQILPVSKPYHMPKKDRKAKFRRSRSYHYGRTTSETDQDCVEMSSSDTTPDPIFMPRFPSRISSPTNAAHNAHSSSPTGFGPNNTISVGKTTFTNRMTKIASADSILSMFRRFSGSSSAPPSPQYSENEESSAGTLWDKGMA